MSGLCVLGPVTLWQKQDKQISVYRQAGWWPSGELTPRSLVVQQQSKLSLECGDNTEEGMASFGRIGQGSTLKHLKT